MVLRVHTTCALVPAIASTMPRVADAMPDRWHRKFSAVRSAVRMPRAGPRITAIRSPGASRLPSARSTITSIAGSISRNAAAAKSSPATTPAWRAISAVSVRALAGTIASVVRSPARPRSSSSAARTEGSTMMAGEAVVSCQSPVCGRPLPALCADLSTSWAR